MSKVKHELDYDLQRRLSGDDWEEYRRLTRIANTPEIKDMPRTRGIYIAGFVVTGLLLIPTGIALGTGSGSAAAWMWAVVAMFFVTLLAPLFTVFTETREVREAAIAGRQALADSVKPKPAAGGRDWDDDDRTPHYPVTGTYDPSRYRALGGRAYAKWLEDAGYGDHETYEANKPD